MNEIDTTDYNIIKLSKNNCQPCNVLQGVLEKLGVHHKVLELGVYSIKGSEIASKYNIRSVPSLIFKDGTVLVGTQCSPEKIQEVLLALESLENPL